MKGKLEQRGQRHTLRFVFPEVESKAPSEMQEVQSKAQDEHLAEHATSGWKER